MAAPRCSVGPSPREHPGADPTVGPARVPAPWSERSERAGPGSVAGTHHPGRGPRSGQRGRRLPEPVTQPRIFSRSACSWRRSSVGHSGVVAPASGSVARAARPDGDPLDVACSQLSSSTVAPARASADSTSIDAADQPSVALERRPRRRLDSAVFAGGPDGSRTHHPRRPGSADAGGRRPGRCSHRTPRSRSRLAPPRTRSTSSGVDAAMEPSEARIERCPDTCRRGRSAPTSPPRDERPPRRASSCPGAGAGAIRTRTPCGPRCLSRCVCRSATPAPTKGSGRTAAAGEPAGTTRRAPRGRGTLPGMTVETATAILLVAVPIAFNLAFFELGRVFDYPGILRKDPDEILRRVASGGSGPAAPLGGPPFRALLGMLPVAVLLGGLHWVRRPGAHAGCRWSSEQAAALVQALGLVRWPYAVPELARRYLAAPEGPDGEATRGDGPHSLFATLHRLLGVGIGEHLGYLLTGLWTLLVSWSMLSTSVVPSWLGASSVVPIGIALVAGAAGVRRCQTSATVRQLIGQGRPHRLHRLVHLAHRPRGRVPALASNDEARRSPGGLSGRRCAGRSRRSGRARSVSARRPCRAGRLPGSNRRSRPRSGLDGRCPAVRRRPPGS